MGIIGKPQIPNCHSIPRGTLTIPRPSRERVLRAILLGAIPWFPAVGFEGLTFWSGVAGRGDLYGIFTGTRMYVDISSFGLGGILASRLLRPRLAIFHSFLNSFVFWLFLYQACFTFISPNGLLHSGCYQTGPDGLAGYRLAFFMFSLESLSTLLRVGEDPNQIPLRYRTTTGILSGMVLATVTSWYPVSAWFSGVLFLPTYVALQILALFGLPGLAVGLLTARVSRSLLASALAGLVSITFLSTSFWGLFCPLCDRTIVLYAFPLWIIFSLVGGFLEVGESLRFPFAGRAKLWFPPMRFLAVVLVLVVSLSPTFFQPYWDQSLLFVPSQTNKALAYGLPAYRPYIGGYFDSLQYRICCLEVGVNFSRVDTSRFGSGNYLMAGMGVQSPNCCVDGWDLGWRADAFLLENRTVFVSADTWGTCDGNANCGGHFWQDPRYHSQTTLKNLPSLDTPIFLRMKWESGKVNWYYNYTGVPWQKYGTFTPDFREGQYFDIGVVFGGRGNLPYQAAFFYQFGVSSNIPINGWTVRLLHPSFMYQGVWMPMGAARVIQGDHSYWKVNYRWGGAPYNGVLVKGNASDPSMDIGIAEFSSTGTGVTPETTLLWSS